MKLLASKKHLLVAFLLLLYSFSIFRGVVNKGIPGVDSGNVLYISQQLLQGTLPYRDWWDHKPPMIYFTNAAGLALAGGSMAGVEILELTFFLIATGAFFYIARRSFGTWVGLVGTLFFATTSSLLLEGGNMTEEWALPFQLLGLAIFLSSSLGKWWRFGLIGVLGAVSFFFKQNLAGVFLAMVIYILFSGIERKQIKSLAAMALGFLVIALLIGAYFFFNHSLGDLISEAFLFNQAYSAGVSGTLLDRFTTVLRAGINITAVTFVGVFSLVGWLELYSLMRVKKKHLVGKVDINLFLFIWLPLEFIFSGVSGRTYIHYFLAWIPAASMVTTFLMYDLKNHLHFNLKSLFPAAFLVFIVWTIGFISLRMWRDSLTVSWNLKYQNPPLLQSFEDRVPPGKTVFFWGGGTGKSFLINRKAASKFVVQAPLFIPHYQNVEMVKRLLNDLQSNKPVLIVDETVPEFGIPALTCGKIDFNKKYPYDFKQLPEMQEVYDFICNNYDLKVEEGYRIFSLKQTT